MSLLGSPKLIEQCLSLPEIGGAEALDEPAVNRSQEISGLRASTLLTPELGKTRGGAQLPVPGTLAPGNADGLGKLGFCRGDIALFDQQGAFDPVQFGFDPPHAGA